MVQRLAVLAFLVSGSVPAASLPRFFEPADGNFVASSNGSFIQISPREVRLTADRTESPVTLRWRGARQARLAGEKPTGGVTNYLLSPSSVHWRTAVPHYARVRVSDLYPGVDIAYYFRGDALEFDAILRPGSNPASLRFSLPGSVRATTDAGGNLSLDTGARRFRLLAPNAYQVRSGRREAVACGYVLAKAGEVGFRLGAYDRTRELIIDPVIEFFTYLGGSGIDHIQAVGADAAGNVIVAGITSSANFPGGGTDAAGSLSIFVTKLNATGTALIFTTILGSRSNVRLASPIESVAALAVDSDGHIYLTGSTIAANFPTTAGAWQQNPVGGFLTRLDGAGKVVYSTFLGPTGWGLTARQLRVRNGMAYVAGIVSSPEFLGTSGAIQRNIAGDRDFFVLAMARDGSSPAFVTAFGGSGDEFLRDMALDSAGNVVLVGSSSSQDFPLTSEAWPYRAPAGSTGGAVMVRIDSTGSSLIFSTWLGTSDVGTITALADGSVVIGGGSALPDDLTSSAPHYSIHLTDNSTREYLARFPAGANRPVWTTALTGADVFLSGLSADAQGNLYWFGYPTTISGGALAFNSGPGISKLSADGSRMLYASPLPAYSGWVGPTGRVYLGGYTAGLGGYPGVNAVQTTPGVVQPQRDPAPGGTTQDPLNYDDGIVGVIDLSSFTGSNFFAVPPQYSRGLKWRIGESAPTSFVQALQLSGNPGPLTVTSSSRLTANYSESPSPAISINVNTAQSAAGTFQESVTVVSGTNPHAALTIPVALEVQPQVSFDLASNQLDLHLRQGEQQTPATIVVTPHFGGEYFSFSVASSASWMSGYVNSFGPGNPVLSITVSTEEPGTYDGTLTVSLQGLQNTARTVQVHCVIDPAATIQLSTTTIQLHVVKGRPVTPAVVTVTSSVPGVQWRIFVSPNPTWLQVTQTTTTTPGEIYVTADPAAAEVGYRTFNLFVNGEAGPRTTATIVVDVSSGAPLDAAPSSISYQYWRGGIYLFQPQFVAFTTPSPTTLHWTTDQPWISPASGTFQTPGGVFFSFDTSMKEGIYRGNITAAVGANNVVIPVTWELYDVPRLVFPSDPISFQWRIGDPLPAPQQLQITCPNLKRDDFYAWPGSRPSFLTVSPEYGTPPATIAITIDPTGLAAGTYNTTLRIGGSYPDTRTYPSIPVTLTVLPNPNAPKASLARVADAASYLSGTVSPGEAMVLFGSGLGPAMLTQAQPGPNGFPASLADWTVYFDEIPAPVLYVSDKQTAVMAPFGIAGRTTTNVTVVSGGTTSAAVAVSVAATNPAVFTADASGSGIAAAVNVAADGSITPHSASSPVTRGGIVTFYAVGLGMTAPAMQDGSLAAAPLPQLPAPVQVRVAGNDAQILYAGPAPGQIAGLMQINIRIPDSTPIGSVPLLVIAGSNPSQPGVTLAVQ